MDASKYAQSAVFSQEYTSIINVKTIKHPYPITYISRLFQGSQLNWAALTKEAYTTYMAVKDLSFYLADDMITLRCDHLPLKTFLQKMTLNAKVNKWGSKLSDHNIKFKFIKHIKNILANTLSKLISLELNSAHLTKKAMNMDMPYFNHC